MMKKKESTARYADIFAALGSEHRLEVMRLLFAAHPQGMTVGDIQSQLKIANSTLSHHLEKLRVEGLVSSRRDKQYFWYSANAETIEDLLSFLYHGCSIDDRALHSYAANEQIPELVQHTSSEKRFMFERFLRSIEGLFGRMLEKVALPRGFERFTRKAIRAISLAQHESRRLGHEYVGTEQLLLGLLSEGSGTAAQALTSAGVNFETARNKVEKYVGRGRGTPADVPFTPRAKRVLELALEQARRLGHNHIGTEHLLLGILREREGIGFRVLEDLGINLRTLERRILQ